MINVKEQYMKKLTLLMLLLCAVKSMYAMDQPNNVSINNEVRIDTEALLEHQERPVSPDYRRIGPISPLIGHPQQNNKVPAALGICYAVYASGILSYIIYQLATYHDPNT